ncbi:MAG: DUF1566 domain-containing protein [Bacteroidota bacterium]|jgi:hypothetical protein
MKKITIAFVWMIISLISANLAAAQRLKPGDSYQDGIIVTLIQKGEPGYEKKVPHGLLVAKADWEKMVKWSEAIQIAKDFRAGGSDQWRVPNKEELELLYVNRQLVGGFQVGNYWTSLPSKEDANGAYVINFYNGYTYTEYRETPVHVRLIRKF